MRDEWQLEMDRLLDLFEHESESSLRKINRRLEVLDCPFNEEFRQYFMKRSTQRLDTSFTKIEMERWDNRQIRNDKRASHDSTHDCTVFAGGSRATVNAHSSIDEDIHSVVKSENVIEITDSDDEDDGMQSEKPNRVQNRNSVEKNSTDNINRSNDVENIVIDGCDVQNQLELVKNEVPSNINVESDGDESMVRNGGSSKSNGLIINASLKSEFTDEEENIPMVTFDPNVETGQSIAKTGGSNRNTSPPPTAANNGYKRVGGMRIKCEHCDSSYRDQRDLRRHQRIHANGKLIGVKADSNGLYNCTHCIRQFANIGHLSQHMKSHVDNEYLYYCARCLCAFVQEASKDKHEHRCKGCHYECHLCKVYVTTLKSKMQNHMRKHSGAKPFCCMVCNKFFQQKSNLRRHSNSIHSRRTNNKLRIK